MLSQAQRIQLQTRLALHDAHKQPRYVERMFVESMLSRLLDEVLGADPPARLDFWLADISRLDLHLEYERLIDALFQALVPAVREHLGDAPASVLSARAATLLRIAKVLKRPEAVLLSETEMSAAFDAAEALLGMARLRDPALAAQARAVSYLAQQLATLVQMSECEIRLAKIAGLVYDLGKLAVAHVIECDGPFSSAQFVEMQRHAGESAALVLKVPVLRRLGVDAIVRAHHERYDGFGYPDRLVGQTIPPLSRILAVADAYHAMTSARPYRPALPIDDVVNTLEQGAGNQWDPYVVNVIGRAVRPVQAQQTQRLRSAG
jgi:HD-GYP domain-containing protein (c-di-GMP phosphodiesterase class II)